MRHPGILLPHQGSDANSYCHPLMSISPSLYCLVSLSREPRQQWGHPTASLGQGTKPAVRPSCSPPVAQPHHSWPQNSSSCLSQKQTLKAGPACSRMWPAETSRNPNWADSWRTVSAAPGEPIHQWSRQCGGWEGEKTKTNQTKKGQRPNRYLTKEDIQMTTKHTKRCSSLYVIREM